MSVPNGKKRFLISLGYYILLEGLLLFLRLMKNSGNLTWSLFLLEQIRNIGIIRPNLIDLYLAGTLC